MCSDQAGAYLLTMISYNDHCRNPYILIVTIIEVGMQATMVAKAVELYSKYQSQWLIVVQVEVDSYVLLITTDGVTIGHGDLPDAGGSITRCQW